MNIIKKDGRSVPMDFSQVRKQTEPACAGLNGVSYELLEKDAMVMISDGMTTTDMDSILQISAEDKIQLEHPDYTYVAARLKLYSLYHHIKRLYNATGDGDVYEKVTLNMYLKYRDECIFINGLSKLNDFTEKYSEEEITELNNYVVGKRDLLYKSHSIQATIDSSLLKDENDVVIELPQYMHMAVAMYFAQNEEDKLGWVKKFYDDYSLLYFINSTPTNSNSRKATPNNVSCLIGRVPDSIEGIFDTAGEVALGSKQGSGWGIDWTRVRSLGSWIGNRKGIAGGKIPFLKIYNDISIAVDQLGRKMLFTLSK